MTGQTETERAVGNAVISVVADLVSDTPGTVSETETPLTRDSGSSDGSDTSAEQQEEDDRILATLRSGDWLQEQEFPPLKYAVPGLIPEGFTLLAGRPKVGKSWFLGNLLLAVASGGTALGKLHIGEARPVLNLALEDGDRRMQSRCWQILGDVPIPSAYSYETHLTPGQVIPYICAFLRRHPDTALIVLDTLGKVMPPALNGESAYQRDYRIGGALKRIADNFPGLALVVIHHDRKAASEDFVESISGTNGLAGSADSVMILGRQRGSEEGVLKVTGRDVPEAEYALTFNGRDWRLDGSDLVHAAVNLQRRQEAGQISETSADIIDFVREQQRHHPDGVRAKTITDKFGPDAATYLRRSVEAGRLLRPKRGFYLVSQLSELSEGQLRMGADSDTDSEVSETDGDAA